MSTQDDLRRILQRIDGRGYKAYKDIQGQYRFPQFTLFVDYVQGDPFAAPSRLRVQVPQPVAGYPAGSWGPPQADEMLARDSRCWSGLKA